MTSPSNTFSFPVSHPLNSGCWEPFLAIHPDQQFAAYLSRGLSHGFHIEFQRDTRLNSTSKNHRSVLHNPVVVHSHVSEEVKADRLKGPFALTEAAAVHISPIGIVPKTQPGKWRLIVDLSHPQGGSVNDGIDPSVCSLKYASVDEAVEVIRRWGPGTLLAKLDLKAAYRMVPVHPTDHHLLGIIWNEAVYVDTALPFGLRSAPKIFTAVADGLAWAMVCNGVRELLHYLDDFLVFGTAGAQEANLALTCAFETCRRLGFQVAPEKVEGPSTCLTFLGIEIDTVAYEVRLPSSKLSRLQELLNEWLSRRSSTRRQLQSLLGYLNHAATVVRPGRMFTRNLIEAIRRTDRPHHFVRLNTQCRGDLLWWHEFANQWNGVSYMPALVSSVSVTSDASGSWGCGAYTQLGEWFQLEWPDEWLNVNIAAKEMVPIAVAAALWGRSWRGQHVLFRSDNEAVVWSINKNTARDPSLLHVLRCFFLHLLLHTKGSISLGN